MSPLCVGVTIRMAIWPDSVDENGYWSIPASFYTPTLEGVTSKWLTHVEADVNAHLNDNANRLLR